MAECPIYKVALVKPEADISEFVTKLHYENCVEEDDLVTITLEKITPEWIDKTALNKGAEISYLFGLQGKEMSGKRLAVIKDFECSYDDVLTGTITALDKGYLFKKVTSNQVFRGKTTSEIIEEIAGLFSIPCEVEATSRIHDSEPMGNLTYWKFMQKLASREGSKDKGKGEFHLFVQNGKLCFKQKDLSKASRRTFTWNRGSGDVISFKPKYEQGDKESSGVQISGIDPETNTPYSVVSKPGETEKTTGENVVHYDPQGNALPVKKEDAGKIKAPVGTTKEQAKVQAKGAQAKATAGELTATLTVVFTVGVEADEIITMAGVAKKHAGNWYTTKIMYDVSESGASTEIELNKNGSKASASETKGKNTDVNKTSGKDGADKSKQVKVVRYNTEGVVQQPRISNDNTQRSRL